MRHEQGKREEKEKEGRGYGSGHVLLLLLLERGAAVVVCGVGRVGGWVGGEAGGIHACVDVDGWIMMDGACLRAFANQGGPTRAGAATGKSLQCCLHALLGRGCPWTDACVVAFGPLEPLAIMIGRMCD